MYLGPSSPSPEHPPTDAEAPERTSLPNEFWLLGEDKDDLEQSEVTEYISDMEGKSHGVGQTGSFLGSQQDHASGGPGAFSPQVHLPGAGGCTSTVASHVPAWALGS